MISKLIDELGANPPPEISALIELLRIAVHDQSYKDLVTKVLAYLPNFAKRKALLEQGYFDGQDFLQLLHASGDGKGTMVFVLMPLLNRLVEWGLVLDQGVFGSESSVRYKWNRQRIAMFIGLDITDNVLLGPSYVARKYRGSVPAVFVEKGGDQFTGTGFVATSNVPADKYVIVTAKHNVDPAEGIKFLGFSEPKGWIFTPMQNNWVLHEKLDIALMPVTCNLPPVPIFPVGLPTVLSRTITLGYPTIATTDAQYLLAHGGELNAVVNTYRGEDRLIISNLVAPGSSGGPVLDEAGLCLGIVVNSFETKHEGGIEKASSAIPACHVLDFIDPYCAGQA